MPYLGIEDEAFRLHIGAHFSLDALAPIAGQRSRPIPTPERIRTPHGADQHRLHFAVAIAVDVRSRLLHVGSLNPAPCRESNPATARADLYPAAPPVSIAEPALPMVRWADRVI